MMMVMMVRHYSLLKKLEKDNDRIIGFEFKLGIKGISRFQVGDPCVAN